MLTSPFPLLHVSKNPSLMNTEVQLFQYLLSIFLVETNVEIP